VKDLGSLARPLPWRIAVALVVLYLLAVSGWVFAQAKPAAAIAAPVSSPKPDPGGTATGGIAD